jgi:hypothetical protein
VKEIYTGNFEWFPETPVAIADLNTEYDDYNSNINHIGKRIDFYYSTNKASKGGNFDISGREIGAGVNLDNNKFYFDVSNAEPSYAFHLLPKINTRFDEYGPFSFYSDSTVNSHTWWYFLYANNETGNFDIRFAYTDCGDWGHYDSQKQIFGPFEANVLNSGADDFYPTVNTDFSKMYFSSNRGINFDIYEIDMDFDNIVEWLKDGNNSWHKNTILSGPGDDKCPYIKGNLMVFASNDNSGFGGYDLWFSVYKNGKWCSPVNFGSRINTKYDEYRPVVEYFPDSDNDLMIFSSNRPGGKGGFDLYYAGILKMIRE